ncbi:unnamed protein product, partial [Lampetra fluviatilis]
GGRTLQAAATAAAPAALRRLRPLLPLDAGRRAKDQRGADVGEGAAADGVDGATLGHPPQRGQVPALCEGAAAELL